ncbi:MAG: 8-amino-7-oxononanoate synthase [Steroidobacteraceae bacterium]
MRRRPDALAAALAGLDSRALRRQRSTLEKRPGARLHHAGRDYLNFSSNDYLGLADHPALAASMQAAASARGTGAGASHRVTGHGPEHDALERELAEFCGRERALLFSTGYMANLGVVMALAGRDDLVLEDRLNHASLLDAALLSRARLERYPHRDAAVAAQALAAFDTTRSPQAGALLVTDGVFSMDGDLAPLPQLAAAARAHEAWLIVDDAHGFGVLGEHGGGVLEHFGLGADDVPVLVGTLGKACGSFGAFVAGDADLVDWLLQRARTYIYHGAAEPVAAATRAALRVIRAEPARRARLRELTQRFRSAAQEAGLPLLPSDTAIQPVIVGDARRCLDISHLLREDGFWVTPIRPPTVPQGAARLRVTLSAAHADADVDRLVAALSQACDTVPAGRE